MGPTGELSVYRDEIVKATGLPPRTVDRHLARAVEAGWLRHEQHGGQGRRSLYVAQIPCDSAPEVARYSAPGRGNSAPSTRWLSPGDSAPLNGALNKESASVSERVAVHDQRGRRRTPVGSGVSATDYLRKSGTYNEWPSTPDKRPSSVSTTAGEAA